MSSSIKKKLIYPKESPERSVAKFGDSMKKAMEMATVVAIIVTLAVGVGMGSVVFKSIKEFQKKGEIERCHVSTSIISSGRLQAEKAGRIFSAGYRDPVKLDCPVVSKGVSEPKNVADELRNCWYKTGGKNNRLGFKYRSLLVDASFDYEKDFCIVCGEITPTTVISTDNVGTYLLDRKITSGFGAGKKYIEFLETKWTEGLTGVCIDQNAACYFLNPSVKRRAHFANCKPDGTRRDNNQEPGCMQSFENFETGKKYSVISLSSGFGLDIGGEPTYTHVFITPTDNIQNIKCDEFYYQAE